MGVCVVDGRMIHEGQTADVKENMRSLITNYAVFPRTVVFVVHAMKDCTRSLIFNLDTHRCD